MPIRPAVDAVDKVRAAVANTYHGLHITDIFHLTMGDVSVIAKEIGVWDSLLCHSSIRSSSNNQIFHTQHGAYKQYRRLVGMNNEEIRKQAVRILATKLVAMGVTVNGSTKLLLTQLHGI